MTQTIIGVFDSYQQADEAVERLTAAGVSRANVQIHANEAGADPAASPSADARPPTVDEDDGIFDKIGRFFSGLAGEDERPVEFRHYHEAVRRGGVLVSVDAYEESEFETVRNVFEDAGAVDIDERAAEWEKTGYTASPTAASSASDFRAATDGSVSGMASGANVSQPVSTSSVEQQEKAFPVVQEELEVGKRQVQTGAYRVYSRPTETPVSESVTLREEHAAIERRPVDRAATEADLREGYVEVRETEEMPVVQKSARVVEEVVVGKESSQRTETVSDTVRGTRVDVERIEGEDTPSTSNPLNPRKDGI